MFILWLVCVASHVGQAGRYDGVVDVLACQRVAAEVERAAVNIRGGGRLLHKAHFTADESLAQKLSRFKRVRLVELNNAVAALRAELASLTRRAYVCEHDLLLQTAAVLARQTAYDHAVAGDDLFSYRIF